MEALGRRVSDRLRVALDVRADRPGSAGIGRYARHLAEALLEAPDGAGDMLLLTLAGAQPLAGLESSGAEVRPSAAALEVRWRRHLWENLTLPATLRAWRADVYHNTAFMLPWRRLRVATVVTVHDLSHILHPELHDRRRGPRVRYRLRHSVARADAVITVSSSVRDDVIAELGVDPDVVVAVPHGVEPRFHPASDPEARARLSALGLQPGFVLAVGTLEPRKNHTRLIEAFGRVAAGRPDLTLVLAGARGWMEDGILSAARSSPVAARIRLLGFVPDQDLPELYRMAAAVAYPSLHEGFGLPVLEAMASGAPVLTSQVSALPEVAGEAAVLVDPLSVDSIASGLTVVLEPARSEQLRAAGPERARRFTWGAAARATREVYRAAAARRRRVAP